jgi:8-amino-7-oxononanoate synthase
MTFPADKFLQHSLNKRNEQNALRILLPDTDLVDFCSNDYLGFAGSEELKNNINTECTTLAKQTNGATGSRLLAGNSNYAENLEKKISVFHKAEAGLIYNSGYDANLGLFSALGRKGDTIIYDELVHASIHDGIRLSKANAFSFKHNDFTELELLLKQAQGNIYVGVESIYSMDGDYALLTEIAALCKKYNANLIVDEAHATGVTKNNGKGRVQELNLETEIFARVHTFSKALGCHGAIVLGSNLLRNFLINFSRSFIYTTALPIKSLVAINQAYLLLQKNNDALNHLNELILLFKNNFAENNSIHLLKSDSPIQGVIVSGNSEVKQLASKIKEQGFDVRAIVSPTVAKGTERLRICIHAFNTTEQINGLCNVINKNFILENTN